MNVYPLSVVRTCILGVSVQVCMCVLGVSVIGVKHQSQSVDTCHVLLENVEHCGHEPEQADTACLLANCPLCNLSQCQGKACLSTCCLSHGVWLHTVCMN